MFWRACSCVRVCPVRRVEESEELMRAFQQQLAARQQQVAAWTAAITEAERRWVQLCAAPHRRCG